MTAVEKERRITAAGDTLITWRWITSAGDTLDPAVERITVRGGEAHSEGVGRGSPFTTQVPDCPSGAELSLRQRLRPEDVLLNVRDLFQAAQGSRNVNQYMDQLAADFTFAPDPEDVQLHPEVYDASQDTLWDRQQERTFAAAIFDARRIGEIRFGRWYEAASSERTPSEDQLTETFRFLYEAEFTEVTPPSAAPSILALRGWMEVDLVTPSLENPVWTIRQWRDQRDAATARHSWGELRAEFAR
ncbi:MAG: hypothetical protein AB1505_03035 [Candidatus Latescibacterota bacterium]